MINDKSDTFPSGSNDSHPSQGNVQVTAPTWISAEPLGIRFNSQPNPNQNISPSLNLQNFGQNFFFLPFNEDNPNGLSLGELRRNEVYQVFINGGNNIYFTTLKIEENEGNRIYNFNPELSPFRNTNHREPQAVTSPSEQQSQSSDASSQESSKRKSDQITTTPTNDERSGMVAPQAPRRVGDNAKRLRIGGLGIGPFAKAPQNFNLGVLGNTPSAPSAPSALGPQSAFGRAPSAFGPPLAQGAPSALGPQSAFGRAPSAFGPPLAQGAPSAFRATSTSGAFGPPSASSASSAFGAVSAQSAFGPSSASIQPTSQKLEKVSEATRSPLQSGSQDGSGSGSLAQDGAFDLPAFDLRELESHFNKSDSPTLPSVSPSSFPSVSPSGSSSDSRSSGSYESEAGPRMRTPIPTGPNR